MSFTANFATKWIFICIPKIVDIWLKTLEIISKKLMKFNINKYIFNLKKNISDIREFFIISKIVAIILLATKTELYM